ncbi:type II secretion system minor pseudopilin GspK [Rhizorhabdus argentea]|uniref:type II secretion system minor pseudopilin GspK n=1 Tax=Rhizorhabdus argentea TaxID=1387174 RepID=UPI0030ED6782
MKPGERGAALLAVLLLVALIATLAALAMDRLALATRLAGNARAVDQARGYALGAEGLATLIVDRLSDRARGEASLPAGWAGETRTIPIEGGVIHARLGDGGACFNLNSLVMGNQLSGFTARPQMMDRLTTLLLLAGVQPTRTRPIVAAITDWIDSDAIPQPQGAEDAAYARAPVPYRTANTLMADVSELRAVAGVTPSVYAALRPWVCALPVSEVAALNVNILPPERAPLLAMLYGGRLSVAQAAALLRSRPVEGWADAGQFRQLPVIAAAGNAAGLGEEIAVRSRWFTLELDVALDGAQVKEVALIDGGIAPSRVVSRAWGNR